MALKSGQDLCHLTNLPFKWASARSPLTCTHTAPAMEMHMLVPKSTRNLKKKSSLTLLFLFLEAYINTTGAICASLVTEISRHVFFHVCFKKIYCLPVRYVLRQNLVHGMWV